MILRSLIICVTLLLSGCQRQVIEPPKVTGIALSDICDRYHVQWEWDGVTQVVILSYRGNKAKALVGSRMVVVGQDKIELSGPIRREKSIIYVPEDFESKVLAPFGVITSGVPSVDINASRVRTIVIDPGHGGKDPGAMGRVTGLKEKTVNLDLSKRLRDILRQAGIKVIMTRDSDEFLSLPERTIITTAANPDLFVSIHANSNPSSKIQGMEVYYIKTQYKKDLDEEQRQINEKKFARGFSAAGNNPKAILADLMYQRKVEDSRRLALAVARHTSREIQALNRGVKPCRFFVVRNTLPPAILIEVGYLTNRQEERKLNTSSYRQKLAEGIAQSILEYANN